MAALRHSDNLWTIFGSDGIQSDNVFALTDRLFAAITDAAVSTVLYHSTYELGQHQLFQPDVGGFGSFAYLPTGERLFVRVRSFFGSNEVHGRALLPIECGETRELAIVVTSLVNPLKQGSVDVIVARYNVVNAPDHTHGVPPHAHRAPTSGTWGISVAPLVLIDEFVPHKGRFDEDVEKSAARKKVVSIGGYEALWSGSTTMVERWDALRRRPASTSVRRGIAQNFLAEWCAGVEKRTRVDLSIVFECTPETFEQTASKSVKKIEKALDFANAHQDQAKHYAENLHDASEALHLANHFLEHSTLAAMVDLMARDTFRGLNLTVFSTPTKFPLYLATCVFLAAFPEMARLPSASGPAHAEDAANCSVLIEMYRNMSTGIDRASNARTSAFEAVLAVACDGCGAAISPRGCKTAGTGKNKTIYVKAGEAVAGGEATNAHLPYSLENMRRQGSALVQELFSHHTNEFQGWAFKKYAAELGKDVNTAAMDVIYDPSWRARLADRRVGGSTGTSAFSGPRSLRVSRMEAMQRVVLEILTEVNTFCESGTYKMARYAAQNTIAEEAVSVETGVERNANACRVMHQELCNFFNRGMSALITDGIPRVMPLRPNTQTKCGDCGANFNPLDLAPRDNCAICESCNVLFCILCYTKRVKALIEKNGGNTLTAEFLAANEAAFYCRMCARP